MILATAINNGLHVEYQVQDRIYMETCDRVTSLAVKHQKLTQETTNYIEILVNKKKVANL